MTRAITRLFTDHPNAVHETYWQHLIFASGFAAQLLVAGLAALIHALFPFLFERMAGRMVKRMATRMDNRQ